MRSRASGASIQREGSAVLVSLSTYQLLTFSTFLWSRFSDSAVFNGASLSFNGSDRALSHRFSFLPAGCSRASRQRLGKILCPISGRASKKTNSAA